MSLAHSLDEKAPRWLMESNVPGLAVAYVRNGSVRWTRVYGDQAVGVPATTQTLYNLASLAKPISAELILRLEAEGRLLDATPRLLKVLGELRSKIFAYEVRATGRLKELCSQFDAAKQDLSGVYAKAFNG